MGKKMNRDLTINMLLETIDELKDINKKALSESKKLYQEVLELKSENIALKAKERARVLELEKDLEEIAKQFSDLSFSFDVDSNFNNGKKAN
jgi:hypothetical protein